jgi:hypothetical protein
MMGMCWFMCLDEWDNDNDKKYYREEFEKVEAVMSSADDLEGAQVHEQ